MGELTEYYFGSSFFVAHVGVWLAALAVFGLQARRVVELRRQMRTLPNISEAEVRRYIYPVERFDHYFDYCASVFIFVGLIGTMYGFMQAFPSLQDPKYDFHDFRNALTVSAFGIVWSVGLVSLVSLYQMFVVAPLFEQLLKKQKEDGLAHLMGQELNKFGAHVTTELTRGLSDFSAGTNQFNAASTKLAETVSTAAQSFTASTTAINQSATKVADIYLRVQRVPAAVVEGLTETFDVQNRMLKAAFTAHGEHLRSVPEAIVSGFTQTFDTQNRLLKEAFDAQLEQLRTIATGVDREVDALPKHLDLLHAEVTEVGTAANVLKGATEDAARTCESFARTVVETRKAVEGLGGPVHALSESIARFDARHIASINDKLDRVLAAAGTQPRFWETLFPWRSKRSHT